MAQTVTLFGIVLFPYSLCMIFGAGICLALYTLLSSRRHKECGEENLFAIEMMILSLAAALPAALLLDSVFQWIESGKFTFGGATFFGGLICALLLFPCLLLLKKDRKVSLWSRLNDLAPCIPAGHWLGRIGCFLGGCCYGKPTECKLGVVFPADSIPFAQYGSQALHPVQLYEAAFLFLLFLGLLFFSKKNAFPLYLIGYGVGRFLLEFLRGDDRGSFLPGLSPAQTISLLLIALGVVLLVVKTRRNRKSTSKRAKIENSA